MVSKQGMYLELGLLVELESVVDGAIKVDG